MCGDEMGECDVEYEKECQKLNKRYREAEVMGLGQ